MPLVFVLHGLTQGANQSINGTDMVPVSDGAGSIAVFPNGVSTCGTGAPGGQLFVGNNAEGIVAATAVWGFLSRFDCASCGL